MADLLTANFRLLVSAMRTFVLVHELGIVSLRQCSQSFLKFQVESTLFIIAPLLIEGLRQCRPVAVALLPSLNGFTEILSRLFKAIVAVPGLGAIRADQECLK